MKMTRQDKDKARLMRENGESYKKIGEKFGVSKQRIHQIINRGQKRNRTAGLCIFKGLSEVIIKNNLNSERLCEVSGVKIGHDSMALKLQGKYDFKMSEIRKLLEFTGMTFEECFAEKEIPGAATPRKSK